MDPLTSAYIVGLLANLSTSFIAAGGARFRDAVNDTPKEKAINRCLQAGLTALLSTTVRNNHEEQGLLQDIFEKFFRRKKTGYQLGVLLKGKEPNLEKLRKLFHKAGYDAETLPGIDFDRAMNFFQAAFIAAAVAEPELQGTIQTAQILNQTQIQQEMLDLMKMMVRYLAEIKADTLEIRRDDLTALSISSGQAVNFEFTPDARPHLETHYLNTLIGECEYIKLSLIDESLIGKSKSDDSASTSEVKIFDVFTPLKLIFDNGAEAQKIADTLDPNNQIDYSKQEFYFLQAVEAAAGARRLVILGQPGGGKSALVNFLTVQLAKKRLNGAFDDKQKMPGWKPGQNTLPLRIILREFAAGLPVPKENSEEKEVVKSVKKAADFVWDYLKNHWEEYYPSLKRGLIENGGIIFFDGLDEVSAADENNKRAQVVDIITQFAAPLHKCTILITCREYAYQEKSEEKNNTEPTWRLDDQKFPVARLSLFEKEEIEAFINTWYKLTGLKMGWDIETCNQKAQSLVSEIKKLPHLMELAQYPLLLTLMVIVHVKDGSLPEGRADLYERTIMLRLVHWENPKLYGVLPKSDLLEKFNIPPVTLRDILAELAFAAHKRQELLENRSENAANISGGELRSLLEAKLEYPDKRLVPYIAKITIDYLEDRAGLLQFRGDDAYAFPHRTFQEYLAAVHILHQPDPVGRLRDLVSRNLAWWREVFLLAAGVSGKDTPRNIVSLVDALLPEPTKEGVNRQNIDRALLASRALSENKFENAVQKEKPAGPYTRTLTNIQKWLLYALADDKKLTPIERVDAGASLARLGDPRKEVVTLDQMSFCYVPGDAYYRGSPGQNMDDHEQRVSQKPIAEAYWISRYPVTQAQFKLFIVAGGYGNSNYWEKAPSWKDGKYDGREAPEKVGVPFELPNHPVVAISWYEALAFTRWLTGEWRRKGILSPEYLVRLPAEREWEKAACGGMEIPEKPLIVPAAQINPGCSCPLQENPDPQRMYPWGGSDANPNRMNFKEANIHTTSPVGCFPGGASPYGCEEMCGNVSEWCFDKWQGGYDGDVSFAQRVIRGGSWLHLDRLCRLTQRTNNTPHYRRNDLGFRLVIAAK